MVLTYRQEYPKILKCDNPGFQVQLVQEWLAHALPRLKAHPRHGTKEMKPFVLMNHCMEKTGAINSERQWQQVFEALGFKMDLISSGCCGMAGTYGHEIEHVEDSKGIFNLSWAVRMGDDPQQWDRFLVTGYSCRAQAFRNMGFKPKHPAQALLEHLILA